jgi:hypothetical protein
LTVGPGVKGVPVKAFSKFPSEREVILPPNQRIMVTRTEKKGAQVVIHAVVLPTLDSQCCPP